jgi:hypothetical protein
VTDFAVTFHPENLQVSVRTSAYCILHFATLLIELSQEPIACSRQAFGACFLCLIWRFKVVRSYGLDFAAVHQECFCRHVQILLLEEHCGFRFTTIQMLQVTG